MTGETTTNRRGFPRALLAGSAVMLAPLLAALPGGCGGPSKTVQKDEPEEKPGKKQASADDEKKKKKEEEELTAEDFTEKKVEEVEAPKYLPDIAEVAQDAFRQGVAATTTDPPDYEKAVEKFRRAIEEDAGFMEAYFNLGMTLERQDKPEKALEVYQKALDENPENVSARAYIAKIYLGKAREARLAGDDERRNEWFDKAKSLLDELVGEAPRNAAVNNAMALYHLAQDDLETAERYVKKVLYVEPNNVTGLNTRGLIYLRRQEFRIAEWIFKNKVLERDPHSTEALTNLGLTYIKLDQRPAAMSYFEDALEESPDNMDVRMNIAAMLLEHLDYKEAKKHYAKVREAQPLNQEAHLGDCHATYGLGGTTEKPKKKFSSAIDCYLAYLDENPGRPDLYRRIASTYQTKLQKYDKAIEFYERYMTKADLSEEKTKEMKKKVKVLRDIKKGGMKSASGGGSMGDGSGDEKGSEGSSGGEKGAEKDSGDAEAANGGEPKVGGEASEKKETDEDAATSTGDDGKGSSGESAGGDDSGDSADGDDSGDSADGDDSGDSADGDDSGDSAGSNGSSEDGEASEPSDADQPASDDDQGSEQTPPEQGSTS